MTEQLTVGSLFAGIGGFDLGLERTGHFKTKWQVEIDPYCQRVLAKHWPDVKRYGDIRTIADLERVDVLCGGFPCQDISFAGPGGGLQGLRSGLFYEYLRIIRMVRPRFVVMENSAALLVRGMGEFLAGLAKEGLDAEWTVLRASDFGAPHERERIWVVAYPNESDGKAWMGPKQDGPSQVFKEDHRTRLPVWLQASSRFIGMDDGVRGRFYESRVGGLGNSILPQIAEWIGNRIIEFEQSK